MKKRAGELCAGDWVLVDGSYEMVETEATQVAVAQVAVDFGNMKLYYSPDEEVEVDEPARTLFFYVSFRSSDIVIDSTLYADEVAALRVAGSKTFSAIVRSVSLEGGKDYYANFQIGLSGPRIDKVTDDLDEAYRNAVRDAVADGRVHNVYKINFQYKNNIQEEEE